MKRILLGALLAMLLDNSTTIAHQWDSDEEPLSAMDEESSDAGAEMMSQNTLGNATTIAHQWDSDEEPLSAMDEEFSDAETEIMPQNIPIPPNILVPQKYIQQYLNLNALIDELARRINQYEAVVERMQVTNSSNMENFNTKIAYVSKKAIRKLPWEIYWAYTQIPKIYRNILINDIQAPTPFNMQYLPNMQMGLHRI